MNCNSRRKTTIHDILVAAVGVAFAWSGAAGCSAPGDSNGRVDPVGQVSQALSTDLVISQVYGGGGSAAAIYTNDFVELFNRGTSSVLTTGMSLQYASAAASFMDPNVTALPSVSIGPGSYFLVQLGAAGALGSALPTPDFAPSSGDAGFVTNMSSTTGRVALVENTTTLGCGSGTRCDEGAAGIVDMVGYGAAAVDFEGTGPAPAPSNTTAIFRAAGGCTDTDDNANDFATDTPLARNSATVLNDCSAVADAGTDVGNDADGGANADAAADTGSTMADSATADAETDAASDAPITEMETGPAPEAGATDAPVDVVADTSTPRDAATTPADATTKPSDSSAPTADARTGNDRAAAPLAAPVDDDSGCSCGVVGTKESASTPSALALLLLGVALVRRKKRT